MIDIVEVQTPKQLKVFIDFQHDLYKGDSNYVPELFIAQKDLLSPGKHPFHEHSKIQLFLAYKDNVLSGRIAAIMNNNHNSFNKVKDGFFGFFDVIDDQQVTQHLFDAAAAWLKKQGAETIVGPTNPTTNDACGLLVEGFDTPPVAMMTYNAEYYARLIEGAGLSKQIDLLAYDVPTGTADERSIKLQQAIENRLKTKGITIRPINMKDFKNEVKKVKEVYNSAWDKNLGFVPSTDAEFNYMAKDMKMILDPNFCLVAEHNGTFIGFALAIPDINEILRTIPRGRLLPFGIFKLLFGAKKIKSLRVLALGVVDGYRKLGIEACFYARIIKRAQERNIRGAEASWILEHNEMMKKGIESINGKVYKKYRIYEKAL
jgi:GNAT superfamily N-acetyltransferase